MHEHIIIFALINPGNRPEENGYNLGSHEFLLNCCDEYGNPHTVAGAVKKAVVEGAGCLEIGPALSLDAILASPPRQDSVCKVTYVGGGSYNLKCSLFGVGTHRLLVTTRHGETECMASIPVTGQNTAVWPPHCFLDPNNVYKAAPFKTYACYIHLFDRYFNSCCGCGSHIEVFLNDCLHPAVLIPVLSPKFLRCKLKFTPQITAEKCELNITVNSMLIGNTPKVFSIERGRSFQERVKHFRECMRKEQQSRRLDFGIVTIERSNILQSALLNQSVLKYNFKIRFKDEYGIDMGGISRYCTYTALALLVLFQECIV